MAKKYSQTNRKSNTSHNFATIGNVRKSRSMFTTMSTILTTFDCNELVPFFTEPVKPGDSYNVQHSLFGRMSTPLYPIMDSLMLDVFYFYVPNRLLWDNWEKMIGNVDGNTDDYITPTFEGTFEFGSIFDKFGLRCNVPHKDRNVLPLRAYNFIWNEYFRDQNLQDEVPFTTGDSDSADNYTLLKRNKRYDYFTSCAPTPQKGDALSLSLGAQAPVTGIGVRGSSPFVNSPLSVTETSGESVDYPFSRSTSNSTGATINVLGTALDGIPQIYADLSKATGITVNDLRNAIAVQQMQELDMRGGSRFKEYLLSHWGVLSSDSRLDRPELLNVATTDISIVPVAQSSGQFIAGSVETTPQGNLSGVGVVSLKGNAFQKSFEEEGFIIGLLNMRSNLRYQQGIEKFWTYSGRYDYYDPIFAHLGEQPVLNEEIFVSGDPTIDKKVFGYQEYGADLRYKNSLITGEFNSDHPQSLDAWHLAQDFANTPTLNSDFIEEDVPMDRIKAVSSEPDFLLEGSMLMRRARILPITSIPGLSRI